MDYKCAPGVKIMAVECKKKLLKKSKEYHENFEYVFPPFSMKNGQIYGCSIEASCNNITKEKTDEGRDRINENNDMDQHSIGESTNDHSSHSSNDKEEEMDISKDENIPDDIEKTADEEKTSNSSDSSDHEEQNKENASSSSDNESSTNSKESVSNGENVIVSDRDKSNQSPIVKLKKINSERINGKNSYNNESENEKQNNVTESEESESEERKTMDSKCINKSKKMPVAKRMKTSEKKFEPRVMGIPTTPEEIMSYRIKDGLPRVNDMCYSLQFWVAVRFIIQKNAKNFDDQNEYLKKLTKRKIYEHFGLEERNVTRYMEIRFRNV